MKVRTLLTAVVTCVMMLLGAPSASAAPSDYDCSTEVIDRTTNQVINLRNLESVIMYTELIGIGDNKSMPHRQVQYMVRVFDDLPGNMSADDYYDAWVDACGSYYDDLDNFKYRPYVLIIADQNSDAGIYSNVFTGDVNDMVGVATGRMRISIAVGNIHAATVMAVDDISSLLAEAKKAPASQSADSAVEGNDIGTVIRYVLFFIAGLAALLALVVWAILSALKRMP